MTVYNPFFWSDPHLGHANIIKYCNRPFSNVEEMDAALIRKYRSVISNDDVVFFLGDIAFYKDQGKLRAILLALPGRKILVRGNHDEYFEPETLACFDEVHNFLEIEVPDVSARKGVRHITLCHYPMLMWNKSHHGSWSLHGHCHGSLPEDKHALRIDVGVDCHNFTPVSYNQIAELMKRKVFKPIDRHGND